MTSVLSAVAAGWPAQAVFTRCFGGACCAGGAAALRQFILSYAAGGVEGLGGYAASAFRDCRFRSCGSRYRFLSLIDFGVTSTSSSSWM